MKKKPDNSSTTNRKPSKNQISRITKYLFDGKMILCHSSGEFLRVVKFLINEGFKIPYETTNEMLYKTRELMRQHDSEIVCIVMDSKGFLMPEIPTMSENMNSKTVAVTTILSPRTFKTENLDSYKLKNESKVF